MTPRERRREFAKRSLARAEARDEKPYGSPWPGRKSFRLAAVPVGELVERAEDGGWRRWKSRRRSVLDYLPAGDGI